MHHVFKFEQKLSEWVIYYLDKNEIIKSVVIIIIIIKDIDGNWQFTYNEII